MANIKLRITGMTCGHCQTKVEKAFPGESLLAGVEELVHQPERL